LQGPLECCERLRVALGRAQCGSEILPVDGDGRLHERQHVKDLGGSTKYVVLDNLREGVIKPDLYEPELNPVYAALLAHYGVVADVCRVGDPNRKGTVENAIQHTQSTALKGRKFESLEEQNAWLTHWEERWAAPRIHGRKKRQVLAMYLEEQPHLRPLPLESWRYFRQGRRTVDDACCIVIDARYYPAAPARLYSEVIVRVYPEEIEILHADGTVLRRHPKSARGPGMRRSNPRTGSLIPRARPAGSSLARPRSDLSAAVRRSSARLTARYEQHSAASAAAQTASMSSRWCFSGRLVRPWSAFCPARPSVLNSRSPRRAVWPPHELPNKLRTRKHHPSPRITWRSLTRPQVEDFDVAARGGSHRVLSEHGAAGPISFADQGG
jgi:hypothetical protein